MKEIYYYCKNCDSEVSLKRVIHNGAMWCHRKKIFLCGPVVSKKRNVSVRKNAKKGKQK